jgi:flagellar operon protein
MERLNKAFEIAEAKGSKNPLVMIDDKAFIVNVPNKTIITVLDRNKMESNAITNIDSAIFV